AEMSRLKHSAVIFQRDVDEAANVRAGDADTPLRLLQGALETLLLFLEPDDALVRLVAELALGDGHAIRHRVADERRKLGGFIAPDAVAGKRPLHPHAKD